MKQTVLKASKEKAEQVSADLIQRENTPGKKIFRRIATSTGFKIMGGRMQDGKVMPTCVFEWVDEGPGRRKFIYDERLLTFE